MPIWLLEHKDPEKPERDEEAVCLVVSAPDEDTARALAVRRRPPRPTSNRKKLHEDIPRSPWAESEYTRITNLTLEEGDPRVVALELKANR
jgi:hypothetical protein